MSFEITWVPCSDDSPKRLLCPYFGTQSDGITSISFRRTVMYGGIIVEALPSLVSISSTTLTEIRRYAASSLPEYPTGSSFYIVYAASLQTVSFPNLVSIGESLNVAVCPSLTSVDLSSLQTIYGWNDDGLSGYLTCNFDGTGLTSLSLPSLVGFDDISLVPYATFGAEYNLALTSVSIPAFVPNNGLNVLFRDNALDQASVDHILARCVANAGFVSGVVRLNGGTNATPSAGGLADKATLIGRGVTVVTN